MRILLAIVFVIPFLAQSQDSDFRRQIQSTTFTRDLLTATNASAARSKLGIATSADIASLTVENLSALRSADVGSMAATGAVNVAVLGYSTKGDWGKQRFARLDLDSTLSVVAGAVETNSSGVGRWIFDDCFGGGPTDVLWFGATRNDDIDDTAAFQAALNWQTNLRGNVLTAPAGRYIIDSVIGYEGAFDGRVHVREQGYGYYGVVLAHKLGATNHLFRSVANGTYRGYQIRNVTFEGQANGNLRNPKSITGVTDRFNFTVDTSDLPSNGGTNTVYPYYGHVFFYTSENKYAGFGIVSNINFSTGLCTLLDNTDAYATLASNTNGYLTVGWKACFSPAVTERSDGGDITRIDPFSAGYSAVSIEGQGGVNYEGSVENINVRGFHAGVRLGPVVAHRIHHVWTKMNVFAGIGTAFSGKQYDLSMGDIQVQGFYEDSYPEVPETLVLTNNLYRYTAYGLYGIDTTGQINDVTADHDVIGAYLPWNSDTIFGQIHIEGPSLHGLWLDGSFWGGTASQGPERTHGIIQTLNIRSHSSLLNNPPMPNPPGRKRYAIYGTYQNNAGYAPRWRIDTLNVGDHTLNTVLSNRFDAIFHADNSNVRVSLGHLDTRSGATNIYSSTTQTRFTPVALGYTEEGRYKLDVQFDEMLGGASTNQYRQDNATKQFRMLGVRYDTDSTDYGAMLGWLDDGSERYWQVGWGAATRPPPTFYQFYGADSYGGSEELWAQWDNSVLKFYGDQFQIRSPQLFVTDGSLTLVNYSTDSTRFMHTGGQTPTETIQDLVGAMAVAGTGMTISYDDVAGTLTFSSTGGSGNVTTNGNNTFTGTNTFTGPLTITTANIATQNVENLVLGPAAIVPIANGGHGGTNAAQARANLDLEPGVDIQAFDPDLSTLSSAGYTGSAGAIMRATSPTFATSLIGDTDAFIELDEHSSTVTTPASGRVRIYPKSDGKIYRKDDAGTEAELGGGAASTAPWSRHPDIVETWLANGNAGNHGWGNTVSGGSATITTTGVAGQPGRLMLNTSSASNAVAAAYLGTANTIFGGSLSVTNFFWAQFSALATTVDEYQFRGGFGDSTSSDFTDGVYWEYNRLANGDFWVLKAANNSTRTNVVTSTPVTTGRIGLMTVINSAGTEVRGYTTTNGVDFVEVSASSGTYPIAANIPTTSGRECGPILSMLKTGGTTGTTAVQFFCDVYAICFGN